MSEDVANEEVPAETPVPTSEDMNVEELRIMTSECRDMLAYVMTRMPPGRDKQMAEMFLNTGFLWLGQCFGVLAEHERRVALRKKIKAAQQEG